LRITGSEHLYVRGSFLEPREQLRQLGFVFRGKYALLSFSVQTSLPPIGSQRCSSANLRETVSKTQISIRHLVGCRSPFSGVRERLLGDRNGSKLSLLKNVLKCKVGRINSAKTMRSLPFKSVLPFRNSFLRKFDPSETLFFDGARSGQRRLTKV